MQTPLQITFRHLDPSPVVEAAVRARVHKLERYFGNITGCHVTIDAPHHHQRQGELFHVSVDLTVPGDELVVARSPDLHAAHDDLYVAIRDAFRAARRELMDYVRRQRGDVKLHELPGEGTVVMLSHEGYGFIASDDGREVYFHAHSVLDGFDELEEGARVRFVEELGDRGPQASTVVLVHPPHHEEGPRATAPATPAAHA